MAPERCAEVPAAVVEEEAELCNLVESFGGARAAEARPKAFLLAGSS